MELSRKYLYFIGGSLLIAVAGYFLVPMLFAQTYVSGDQEESPDMVTEQPSAESDTVQSNTEQAVAPAPVTHIATPLAVKGLYMTGWVAGTQTMRNHVISLLDKTEANAVVIDIKDYTGKIAYPVEDPALKAIGSSEKRIPDLRALTTLLHEKGIYVIARIACFQDPYFVKIHPEYAVKTASDPNKVWKDRKGISWLDAGEKPVWEYLAAIARDAHSQGVDEIQFDYIRFPSDGNMKDIYYPASEGKAKVVVLREFFEYLHGEFDGSGIVTSADLFGMTTTNTDDLGIGQNLEDALRNFDYVSPMVYPSHYPKTWSGFSDPEAYPYETIKIAMGRGVERAKAIGVPETKLRPWLQDFGLRVKYGPKEVRAQIQATYDVGLTSWLLWDPKNVFTAGALNAG